MEQRIFFIRGIRSRENEFESSLKEGLKKIIKRQKHFNFNYISLNDCSKTIFL